MIGQRPDRGWQEVTITVCDLSVIEGDMLFRKRHGFMFFIKLALNQGERRSARLFERK